MSVSGTLVNRQLQPRMGEDGSPLPAQSPQHTDDADALFRVLSDPKDISNALNDRQAYSTTPYQTAAVSIMGPSAKALWGYQEKLPERPAPDLPLAHIKISNGEDAAWRLATITIEHAFCRLGPSADIAVAWARRLYLAIGCNYDFDPDRRRSGVGAWTEILGWTNDRPPCERRSPLKSAELVATLLTCLVAPLALTLASAVARREGRPRRERLPRPASLRVTKAPVLLQSGETLPKDVMVATQNACLSDTIDSDLTLLFAETAPDLPPEWLASTARHLLHILQSASGRASSSAAWLGDDLSPQAPPI